MRRGTLTTAVLVILLVGTSGLSAAPHRSLRLGLEFGNPNAVIIIRPAPFDFRVGYNFQEGNQSLFLSGDYRIVSGYQLVDFLHLFLGVGAYTQIELAEGTTDRFGLGGRIPFGLQAFLLANKLELFLEICPTVSFLPTLDLGQLQGYLGFTLLVR